MPQHWIRRFAQGYRAFRQNYFETHRGLFEQLRDGQNPKVMLVGCCDSRVEPSIILDAQPGDLFIARNIAIKARIVEADEHETKGIRALLNLGHTIGHGIEAELVGYDARARVGNQPIGRHFERAAVGDQPHRHDAV